MWPVSDCPRLASTGLLGEACIRLRFPFLFRDFSLGQPIASLAHPWRRTGAKDSEKVGKTGPRNRPDTPDTSSATSFPKIDGPEKGVGTLSRARFPRQASMSLLASAAMRKDPFPGRAGADHGLRCFWFWCPVSWYPAFPELGNVRTARCKNADGVESSRSGGSDPFFNGPLLRHGKVLFCEWRRTSMSAIWPGR